MTEQDEATVCRLRGVESPCATCRGLGVRWYSSGATWRGGMGTASCKRDVCDRCWGTGDAYRIGVDLRAQRDNLVAEIERRAATMLCDRVGASLSVVRPALEQICAELDKLARGRKPRPGSFYELCELLAKILRGGIT